MEKYNLLLLDNKKFINLIILLSLITKFFREIMILSVIIYNNYY